MDYSENFELWAQECVRIADKATGQPIPFVLNAPQRRVLAILEQQRLAGKPIRLIMLKARQWGGSTLVQVYMAWMQLVRRKGWNSVICAHVKDAASGIRGMFSRLLRHYPPHLKELEKGKWELLPYEKSSNICRIEPRDCILSLASANAPDSLRGYSFMMAHLSEVAFWGEGDKEAAEKIVRTVSGSVPTLPDTLVVMESTADGDDNYFHDEWQRAVRGESDKTPIFVPWYELELYRLDLQGEELRREIAHFDAYERNLMERQGVEAQRVAWYHRKRREYPSHEAMMAEFPSTPEEAFATSGQPEFSGEELPKLVGDGGLQPQLAILIPGVGSRPTLLSSFAIHRGAIVSLSDTYSALSIGKATETLCEPLLGKGVAISVVDLPGSKNESSRVSSALKKVLEMGFVPETFGDEEGVIEMTDELVGELAEGYREMECHEVSEESIKMMRRFRIRRYRSCPEVVARMVACRMLPRLNGRGPISVESLLPFC